MWAVMKALGHFFMILFIIVVILGFYIGTELSERELGFRNPLEGMPLNSWEFNFGAALIVWLPGSGLLIASMVFYWMNQVTENLAGMQSVLKEIAGNTKQAVVHLGRKFEKESSQEYYSKLGDSPQFSRFKGESDSSYWDRVSKGQYFSNFPKNNDDPRFPRLKDELDYDYWERVKKATHNM